MAPGSTDRSRQCFPGPDTGRDQSGFIPSAGGELPFFDGAAQPSCGPFPTLAGTLWRLALPKNIRKNNLLPLEADGPQAVDWVTGAFMGFSRELFERVGGFDEDYFMYYEDVDFCLRARRGSRLAAPGDPVLPGGLFQEAPAGLGARRDTGAQPGLLFGQGLALEIAPARPS